MDCCNWVIRDYKGVGGGGGAWPGSRGDNADFSLMECSFTIRAENPKRNRRPDKPRIIPTISF